MEREDDSTLFSSTDEEESLLIGSEDEENEDDENGMENDAIDNKVSEHSVNKLQDYSGLKGSLHKEQALWPLGKDVLANLQSFQVPQNIEAHVNALKDSILEKHLHNFHTDASKFEQNDLGLSSVENRNTQRKTDTDIRILISYMHAVNENRPPELVPPQQLDKYLSNFFTIVKKHDGNEYEPASLRGMLCSVERYLKMKNYHASVTRDAIFINTRLALKNKQQKLRDLGKGGKKSNEPFGKLTIDKVKHLFAAREMGPYTPMSIINTLCFLFIVHFRLRKAIDHKNLTWGDIQLCTDSAGKEYLVYKPKNYNNESSKLQSEKNKHSNLCIWAQPEAPERNPVGIYKSYRDKRPVSMLFESSPFYLGITTLHPSPVQAWYRTCAMGVNKLSDLVRMIRDITGLPRATLHPPVENLLSNVYSTSSTTTSTNLKNSFSMPLVQQYIQNMPPIQSTMINSYGKNDSLSDIKCSATDIASRVHQQSDLTFPRKNNLKEEESNISLSPPLHDRREGSPQVILRTNSQHTTETIECMENHADTSLASAKKKFTGIFEKLDSLDKTCFKTWLKQYLLDGKYDMDDEEKISLKENADKGNTTITLHINLTPEILSGKGPVTLQANTTISNFPVVKPTVMMPFERNGKLSESKSVSSPVGLCIDDNFSKENTKHNFVDGQTTVDSLDGKMAVNNVNETITPECEMNSFGKKRHYNDTDDLDNAKQPRRETTPVNLSNDRHADDSVTAQTKYVHATNASETVVPASSGSLLQSEDRSPKTGSVIPQAHASRLYPSTVRDMNMLLPMNMGYSSAMQRVPDHFLQNSIMLNSLTSSLSQNYLQQGLYCPYNQTPNNSTGSQSLNQVETDVQPDDSEYRVNFTK